MSKSRLARTYKLTLMIKKEGEERGGIFNFELPECHAVYYYLNEKREIRKQLLYGRGDKTVSEFIPQHFSSKYLTPCLYLHSTSHAIQNPLRLNKFFFKSVAIIFEKLSDGY